MPWNGSAPNQTYGRTDGTRTGQQTWQQADAAGVDIIATDHDTHDQDIADAINATLKKDGGNSATSNIPMGGFTLTNLAAATSRTNPARFSDVQDGKGVYIPTVGGSANAITLTSGYSVSAYVAGQTFRFIAASTNSGAVTIALDGLAAKDVKVALAALTAGMITAGQMITVTYDGTQFQMQAESPASIGVGSIVAWATSTIPAGWLECTGAAISRSTYSALFAAIGTTYGVGDGSTTFNLPDYRGYFLRGQDGGAASDPNAATRTDRGDGTTGDNVGTKQGSDYLSHTHTGTTSSNGAHTHTYTAPANASGGDGGASVVDSSTPGTATSSDGAHTHTFTTAASPTSGGSETRPKNINVKWIILAIPAASVGSIAVDSASVTFLQSGTGAVERTSQSKMRDAYHAKDFGVLADDTTDDSTAFAAAWAAAAAAGRALLLPPGTMILNRFTFSSHVPLIGDSRTTTTLKRLASATTGTFIDVTATAFTLINCTVDGNKAANSNGNHNIVIGSGCVNSHIENVRSINAKANAGWGTGIYYEPGSASGRHIQKNVDCASNDGHGCQALNIYGFSNDEACTYQSNGVHGLFFNNYDLTFAQKLRNIHLSPGARYLNNTQHGCVIDNFLEDNVQGTPNYGPTNPEASDVRMGGYAAGNARYGFSISGTRIWAAGLQAVENASSSDLYAGILWNASHSTLLSPQAIDNDGFGIDAGGSSHGSIVNPKVWDNGNAAATNRPGLNLEGCINVLVTEPDCGRNGHTSGGINIQLDKYGGASSTTMFDFTSSNVVVRGGLIYVDETRYGIYGKNNPEKTAVQDVIFSVASSANIDRCIVMIAADPQMSGNRVLLPGNRTLTPASNVLTVPDVLDFAVTNSAAQLNSILTGSMALVSDGVAYVTITNGGSGYTSAPTVSFSGGGGSGAAAVALIDAAGVVRGVRMTAHGSGYSSAPTVGFSGGGGSSAAATATWRLATPEGHEIAILSKTSAIVLRAGTPNVLNPETTNLRLPANSTLRLRGMDGVWYATDYRKGFITVHTAAGAVTVASSDDVVIVNKSAGAATTANLSSSPATNQRHTIKDGKGDAATNPITITPASGTIDGASTYVMNLNYQSATVVYNGTEWNVI